MVCPSGQYLDAVRTIGGLTPKRPYGTGLINISSEFDYAEWHTLIGRLRTSLEVSWRELQAHAMKKNPEGWKQQLVKVGELVQSIRDRAEALFEPWDFTELHDRATAIDKAVTLALDTACAWQKLDEELEGIGVEPPEKRPNMGEDDDLGILGTILLVGGGVAIVGGTLYVARVISKRRSSAT